MGNRRHFSWFFYDDVKKFHVEQKNVILIIPTLYTSIDSMKKITLVALLGASISFPVYANTIITMETNVGVIELELYDKQAPISTQNFKNYVQHNFYNGTIFHRVIPNFMIQGGGVTAKLEEKKTNIAIKNESQNGLKNERGTLAMARKSEPDSATSQFYII